VSSRTPHDTPEANGTSRPVAKDARRGHTVARRITAALSVTALLVTLASTAGWSAINHLSGNISTVDVDTALGSDRPTKAPTSAEPGSQEPLNILVMGTDTRTGQGSGYGNAAHTASGNGHSDTTILLHVSADRKHALAVSIPRDSWVTRPSCKGGGTTTGRFNAAFAAGGPACTIKAVETLTGVRVDHFFVVDFKGFKAVVDSLGGVPICLKDPVDDPKSGLKLTAGTHLLDGNQALAFARARETLGDGSDIGRINRQQVFLSSVIRTALSKNVLTDLPTLYSVVNSVTQSLTADTGLGSSKQLIDLALSLQGLSPSKIHFMTVPWVPRSDHATIEWNDAKATPIWQSMILDTVYPPAPPAATVAADGKVLTAAPATIRVTVLNGTGVTGKAREVADQLRALGYVVVDIATAPAPTSTTTVVYDPRYDESARTLAYATQATSSTPNGTTRTLVLTIGSDWKGTRAVVVKAPTSTSTRPPTTTTADEQTCVN